MVQMDAYENFDFEQFVEDPKFRNWAMAPTDDDDVFWLNFLTIYPYKEELVNEAKAFLQGTMQYFDRHGASNKHIEQRLEHVFQKVDSNVSAENLKVGQRTNQGKNTLDHRRKNGNVYRMAIAAAMALLVGTSAWLGISHIGSGIVYATNFGEWKTIELPDGSTVQLNANSQLSLKKKWKEGTDREVHLIGEAFFKVSKKPATGAKFTVVTNDLALEVLGTSFNVFSRGEATEVFLQEGKVRLEHGENELLMLPGDFVSYSGVKEKILGRYRRDEETEIISPHTWKDGVLMFRDEYAFPILEKLEEIYGVKIEVKNDAIYTKKYNVNVPMGDLTVVIATLEKSMDVKITREKAQLILE